MKKRNLVIVAFMLVAAMTIGVGYAALSVELTLTGNAAYDLDGAQDDFEADVYFESGEVVTKDTTGSGSTADTIGEIDAHAVTFNVTSPIYAGEKAVFEFVVKNESATEVYLTWDKTQWVSSSTNYTLEFSEDVTSIAANASATVRVVATLKTVPGADLNETFTLKAKVSDVP